MDDAAGHGHLETVTWLHERFEKARERGQGTESPNRTEGCTTSAMNLAASGGHLETRRWLHERFEKARERGQGTESPNQTEGCTTRAMDLSDA